MRKTRIVCTIGPASGTENVLERMIRAGMDVARINCSHGTHDEHLARIKLIRKVGDRLRKPIAILMDLQGPRVRVGSFAQGSVVLKKGAKFTLTARSVVGDEKIVSVSHKKLPKDVKKGDPIYLNDGLIRLVVNKVSGDDVVTEIVEGGKLSDHKGINLPASTLSTPTVTSKDVKDIAFGVKSGVDYIGLSFVRSADDVLHVRRMLEKTSSDIPIVAKIEKHEALARLEEIVHAADGIMVARGDLGVETPLEEVPGHQKIIIAMCSRMMKPVITATQMLESMIENARPTRAEASDVANAILDGTDAVMLSAETSVGKHPVEAVKMMALIATEAEKMSPDGVVHDWDDPYIPLSDSVAQAACFLAERIEADAIIAFTESGFTARLISKFRPTVPVLGVTPRTAVMNRMSLYRGVTAVRGEKVRTVDEMIVKTVARLVKTKLLKKGDSVVITAGAPVGVSGNTNLIKVHTI